MTLNRRHFLAGTVALATSRVRAIAQGTGATTQVTVGSGPDWDDIRSLFALDPKKVHLAGFFLSSHPKPVRDAIERYRHVLDADPIGGWEEHRRPCEERVIAAAGEYLGVARGEVALTDSTTMGLGVLYSGLRLAPGDEILSTTHDHYATRASIEFAAQKNGAAVRTVPLYSSAAAATVAEIVDALAGAIGPRTRVVAVTWVHSSTGVRLPIRAMADAIDAANRGRDEADRVVLCVDGVHGLGVEDVTLPELGCDFFVAGTHKWLFGPRGTGVIWGRSDAWSRVRPTIPPFGPHDPPGMLHTPGGFHSFEHRWALDEAFKLHLSIGKRPVRERIHNLNRRIKDGLAEMPHVVLHTPRSDDLSAGIVCFDVRGMRPGEVVRRLAGRGIVASESPYTPSCARLAGSLLVDEAGIEQAITAVAALG